MQKAVFIDRDGVLNKDKGYVYRPADLEVLAGVPEALRSLKEGGYLLLVVTNQSGVARGLYPLAAVHAFNELLADAIVSQGGPRPDGFFVCPHHPDGNVPEFAKTCSCRKPGTGLVDQACAAFPVDRAHSYMVGDKESDVQCGRQAGLRTIQVAGRYGEAMGADARCRDLLAAARLIIAGQALRPSP